MLFCILAGIHLKFSNNKFPDTRFHLKPNKLGVFLPLHLLQPLVVLRVIRILDWLTRTLIQSPASIELDACRDVEAFTGSRFEALVWIERAFDVLECDDLARDVCDRRDAGEVDRLEKPDGAEPNTANSEILDSLELTKREFLEFGDGRETPVLALLRIEWRSGRCGANRFVSR